MTILPVKNYINKIVHLGDLHIRLNKRKEEYNGVFNTFFDMVRDYPKDETIIVNTGDTFHTKLDLQPEGLKLAETFLRRCADLFPTILIAGNHDGSVVNASRLDSLTPLVDAINHPNLFYLKASGLYGCGNILFNNMSVFDAPEKYIRGQDIPAIYRNQYEHVIALYHGPVDQAVLDTGYLISNPAIMITLFDYHDAALLGDIHKIQNMQDYDSDNHKPCIHYCGSLIMQNHGESLTGHGYSLWDLKTRTYIHYEVPNDYGYFTIDIQKGNLTTDLTDLPKHVRLRVKCYESIASEVKQVIADIKMKTDVIDIAYVRMDQERDKKDIIPLCKDIVLADLTDVDYQTRLITEFVTKKLGISDSHKLDTILTINRNTNLLVKKDEFSRNLKWKLVKFRWSNMFAYGEDNEINFENMSGVYGIFGPNRSGKSSILDAIIFCLFDKTSRCYKGAHVLNVQKSSFQCQLEFEIAGIHYFIERKGSTTRSGNVKVDVRFWKVVNGVEEELHGTVRRDTNDIIRDYVGTYEDFILTAASFQSGKNLSSFIDMGNSERKDLLVQFMGLNVFDRLHEAAGERNKELLTILKTHADKNYQLEIQQNQGALAHADTLFTNTSNQVESLKKQMAEVNERIVLETANLIKLDTDVPTDLESLEARRATAESTLIAKRKFISDTKEVMAEIEKQLANINAEIEKIEKSNFIESHKTYKELADKITRLKQKIDLKKVEIKGKLEKVERLKNHKYDPNCKFCVDNDFVRDATKAKKELPNDKQDTDIMLEELNNLRTEFTKYQWVEKSYETYTKLLTDRGTIKDKCAAASKNIIISTNELERLDTSFKAVIQQIEIYHRNEVAVEANLKVQSKITTYRNTLGNLDVEFQKQNRLLMDISGKRELFKLEIKRLTETIEEVSVMEIESEAYHHYLDAVGRDGIPFQVICNAVPEIEKEVNSILSQVVDYTIQFDTDGKNVIPYISYPDIGKYPIELSSGFERFIASIAIRVSISTISNLPRISAIFVDEGWSTLDVEHLSSMPTLFTLLRNYFDFVIIISHNEALRDAVDKHIEISHSGGFAKVVHE